MNTADERTWFRHVTENLARDDGLTESAAINERRGPFPLWERLASPEGPCQLLMENAVYIALGDHTHPLCGKFLDWAISIAERALVDPRFEIESENRSKGWKNPPFFPGNRGQVLAIREIASALKNGVDVGQFNLREAADLIATSALLEKGRDWASRIVQGDFLYAVRLLMIAGEWAAARKLISVRRKFQMVNRQHEIISGLLIAGNVGGDGPPDPHSPAWCRFLDYFKFIRVPEANSVIAEDGGGAPCFYRMQMAIIRQRIISRGDKISWAEVFAAVGAAD